MAHPRIEEVEDSDLEMSDPSEADIEDFDESEILRQRPQPGSGSAKPQPRPAAPPPPGAPALRDIQTIKSTDEMNKYSRFQHLYPIYFDAARTRADGRRVSRALAVANPLAGDIVTACGRLGLPTLFEPAKTHPKDWANPGRVRVKLDGPRAPGASGEAPANKHHLLALVARHLAANPATEASAALRTPGAPVPDPGKPYPRPAVPRGWKINELLPYISPAMTGGGVSENLFKDMMKEMQGGGDPMAALMGGPSGSGSGGGEEKKEKKGKKKGKS